MAVVTKYNAIVYTADAVADKDYIFAPNALIIVGTALYRGDGVKKLSALSPIGDAVDFEDLTGEVALTQLPSIPTTKVTGILPIAQVPALTAEKVTSVSAADLPTNTDVTDIAKSDTLIAALQKLQNRIAALEIPPVG